METLFAEINEQNIVQRVIVVESAEKATQLLGGVWKQTYSNDINKNYAGIGYTYYPSLENFSSPQPFPSWNLDNNCRWNPPTPYPNDGKRYMWNEPTLSWAEI